SVGAYSPGSDPQLDLAVNMFPTLEAFLQKAIDEREGFEDAVMKLHQIFGLNP
ncbi:MAG: flagellum-specific ATP synthase FliI, partial [Methyloversatilis sp.]|nr:flagellum-specific ATP synthase FliI [Methyloversatilis sp.]